MTTSLRIPAADVKSGQFLAFTYKNVDKETWVRAERVRKVTVHRDGRTTVTTDYTTRVLPAGATVLRSNDTFNPTRVGRGV